MNQQEFDEWVDRQSEERQEFFEQLECATAMKDEEWFEEAWRRLDEASRRP